MTFNSKHLSVPLAHCMLSRCRSCTSPPAPQTWLSCSFELRSFASSNLSSQGTVSSTMTTCLVYSDVSTMSGQSEVAVMWFRNLSCLPRSTWWCQSLALARSPPRERGCCCAFSPALTKEIKSNHFYCHITTAQVPWWVKFLRACSRQCKKTKQQFTYGQYIFTDCTEDNVQNTHTNTQYTQCTKKTYFVTNAPIHIIHRIYTSALCPHLCIVICEDATDYNLQ